MLKLILRNRCKLCSAVIGNIQILPQNIRYYGFSTINLDDVKLEYSVFQQNNKSKRKERKVHVQKITSENIERVKAILKKYNINTADLRNDSKIFKESPWVVEQRIMFLQELGATIITLKDIQKFIMQMYLPVSICKANFAIKQDVNLAKNVFSWIDDNSIFTRESLTKFDETMPMRMYYAHCFFEYLKSELDLDEDQINRISPRKSRPILYNSFRLLNRVLKLLRDDLHFTTDFIIKNYWLLGQHPEYVKTVIEIVENNFQEVSNRIFLRYPKVLVRDIKDFEVLLSYLKQYQITNEMVGKGYQVLKLKSDEFKRRMEVLSKIPFTIVYLRHPRFLTLVKRYHTVLPRVRYLESKNFKFATINSLTSYHNYLELLTTQKKTSKTILKCFCDTVFGEDADELMQHIEAHPCWMFIPTVQMYETLVYLKDIFSTEVIYKHVYALLYNKMDLEVARESLLEDPAYSKLPPDQFLALCVYKIEEKCHFSGEAVLAPEKYAELAHEDRDGKIKAASNEHYEIYADKVN